MCRISTIVYLLLAVSPFNSFGQVSRIPVETIYKQIESVNLKMEIYNPDHFKKSKSYPTMVFFFGGGWNDGTANQFRPFALHYAAKGMITVLVDYRVKTRHGTTPFESLKDAKSAIRYLRKRSADFGIDPNQIVGSGGSAGGHLAVACFTNETINDIGDDLTISPKPNALVLFNPVIDNSKEGYGYDRIGERYLSFSPLHNIHKGFPPTIFFLGTKDKLIPVSTAKKFKQKVDSVGSRCEIFLYDGGEHGFFNKTKYHEDIFAKADFFLQSIGYLKAYMLRSKIRKGLKQ